ncbi:uncharacterized protein TNCV_4635941 [Trichonephila clavipes]|nr:uncharacterized protein TNCV_4635941 [Trichonephila clavipes]
MNSDLMSLTEGNITDYVLEQHIKTETQNNMNEGKDNIEKAQDSMEEAQQEYNHILEQAMTEALPTSNNDNSAHHDGSEKQDKWLTDTVDPHSFEEIQHDNCCQKRDTKKSSSGLKCQ